MIEKSEAKVCEDYIKKFLADSKIKPETDVSNAITIITADILRSLVSNILENKDIAVNEMDGLMALKLAREALETYMEFLDSEINDNEYDDTEYLRHSI